MTEPTKTFSIRAKETQVKELDHEAVKRGLPRNQVIVSRLFHKPWYKRWWAAVFKSNT